MVNDFGLSGFIFFTNICGMYDKNMAKGPLDAQEGGGIEDVYIV